MTTPTDFQQSLQMAGFDPIYIDGEWGPKTENATNNWFKSGRDIAIIGATDEPQPPLPATVVPGDWMPACKMSKIIVHWTAGGYSASENDREHYHILVDGDFKLVRGIYSIKANVSTSDSDGYAAHTKNCNTGSIGISACCMAGAIENPFSPGKYPLQEEQWDILASIAADLCKEYSIPIGETTVLQHGEVEVSLGIAQSGKWDICRLPWEPDWNAIKVGDDFRYRVEEYYNRG
jgi:hypothetical protein